ncbi:protein phosphatase, partial [Streptomyces sp. SID7909]|nr:protein phosphatase [Streptomyces sp. SID7909]
MNMSQNHQETALPRCPGCEEPLEQGDLFCGACGYDLSAVPEPPLDRPTVAIATPAAAVDPASGVRYDAPAASGDFELAAPGAAPDPRAVPEPA